MKLGQGLQAISDSELPNGWVTSRIGDSCDVVQGGRLGLTKQDHYQTSGYTAYSAAGQDGFVRVAEFEQEGVVLSAIGANCGRCFYANRKWTTLANVQAILPDTKRLSAKFLYYRVNVDGFWPRSGSAQPFIKPSDVLKCWVAHPSDVAEQIRIVAVLDTVDEAIAKTEAVIAKLRQVRAGLLHDLLTRGLDKNGQLRDPIAHPEQFQDSPLGRIPKEWETARLGDLVPSDRPIVYGILMPGRGFRGGVPVIKVKDIRDGQIDTSDLLLTDPRIDEAYRRSRVRTGDLLFTIRGTVGRMAFVPASLDNANITQDTARISLRDANPVFVARWLETPIPSRFIDVHTIGVAVRGINLGEVRRIPVVVPVKAEQDAIASVILAAERQIESEVRVLECLLKLKSGLMTDLLTGRVRVPAELKGIK